MHTFPLIALALLACAGEDPEEIPAICDVGSRWSEGQTAFVDASAGWGLDAIEAAGIRINAVDFDGDGWTDLAVRSGTTPDDFTEGGARSTWLLRNTGEGRFVDVTEAAGVAAGRSGETAGRPVWAFGDLDNDGDLDLYAGLPDGDDGDEASETLFNDGDGTFSLATRDDDPFKNSDNPYGAALVDYDRDGLLDLWLGQYPDAQDLLYRGDGAGGWENVISDVGLKTESWSDSEALNAGGAHTYAWSAAACDLNNDGWPELLSASYGRAPNHLWRGEGDGQYSPRGVESGYAWDHRDDWSDNQSARCWCKLHPDDADCDGVPTEVAWTCDSDDDAFRWNHSSDRQPYRLGGNSGATICADVDNDGWMDLMTSEIVHWDVGSSSDPSELLFNAGEPEIAFERPGNDVTGLLREREGSSWDDGDITGSVFDFDNDGWPDVYIGSSDYEDTRGLLFHQGAPRAFSPVPIDQGIDHTRSHGSAIADFDNDGDLDVVVGHSSARCSGYDDCYESYGVRLFENQLGETSNVIQLHLEGSGGSNRAAIGARVRVAAGGVTQTQEVDGGHGQWGNQDDLRLHFGLGEACQAEVEIRWPDAAGTTETFTLGAGYRYAIVQGGGFTSEAI